MSSKEETSIELQERLQSLRDQLASLSEPIEDAVKQTKANLLFELGKTEIEAGNFEAALPHLEESASLHEEESIHQAEVFFELSTAYLNLTKLDKAENYIKKSINTYNLIEEIVALHKAIRQLALIYAQQGNIEDAEKLIQKKIEHTTTLENWQEAGKFYGFAGELAAAQKNYQIAFNHFRNGLKALKKTNGNHETMGEYYEALARLLLHFKKNEEAIHSFEEAATAFQLANKPLLQGGVLTLIAKIWEGEGKYLKAIPYLQQATEAFKQSDEDSSAMQTADAHYQAAYLYEQEKQWENALAEYKAALPFAQKTDDEMMIASVEDSIEQCEEKLHSKSKSKKSSNNDERKKSFLGKLKDMFG